MCHKKKQHKPTKHTKPSAKSDKNKDTQNNKKASPTTQKPTPTTPPRLQPTTKKPPTFHKKYRIITVDNSVFDVPSDATEFRAQNTNSKPSPKPAP
ncbi:MAG: hypothetical protein LBH74_02225 [Nitrososphaerota archaeon]|nr:hypothetical protein [Nitrososphaerota archaeon]